MAIFTLKDVSIWLAQYDISGDFRSTSLQITRAALDKTTWGQTTRINKAGLYEIALSGEGFFQADSANPQVDDALSQQLGLDDVPVTLTPLGAADGNLAYFLQALVSEYSPFAGSVGDLTAFSMAAVGAGNWARGTIMLPKASRTASGNGVARQLGAVSAGKKVFAALHVFSASVADTLDVIIQSDAASDFLSPVNQITFAQKTAAGAEFKSAAGPITDDWWRVNFTIAGTTPDFTFGVVIGIR